LARWRLMTRSTTVGSAGAIGGMSIRRLGLEGMETMERNFQPVGFSPTRVRARVETMETMFPP
jgi:hypothetical protein